MTPAGFNDQLAGYQTATEAETNLISKNDTNGAVIKITGISLYLSETSDAALAKQIWANTYVDTTLDGVNQYLLIGRMGRIPSAGGLYGNGDSLVTQPGSDGADRARWRRLQRHAAGEQLPTAWRAHLVAPREQDGLEISDPLSGRAEPLDRLDGAHRAAPASPRTRPRSTPATPARSST